MISAWESTFRLSSPEGVDPRREYISSVYINLSPESALKPILEGTRSRSATHHPQRTQPHLPTRNPSVEQYGHHRPRKPNSTTQTDNPSLCTSVLEIRCGLHTAIAQVTASSTTICVEADGRVTPRPEFTPQIECTRRSMSCENLHNENDLLRIPETHY